MVWTLSAAPESIVIDSSTSANAYVTIQVRAGEMEVGEMEGLEERRVLRTGVESLQFSAHANKNM